MKKIVQGDKKMSKPAVIMTLPVDPELKRLIREAARADNMPMNEWVAKVVADYLGKPELARVPRKDYGRPAAEHAHAS